MNTELHWNEDVKAALLLLKLSNPTDVDCDRIVTEIIERQMEAKELVLESTGSPLKTVPEGRKADLDNQLKNLGGLARFKGC